MIYETYRIYPNYIRFGSGFSFNSGDKHGVLFLSENNFSRFEQKRELFFTWRFRISFERRIEWYIDLSGVFSFIKILARFWIENVYVFRYFSKLGPIHFLKTPFQMLLYRIRIPRFCWFQPYIISHSLEAIAKNQGKFFEGVQNPILWKTLDFLLRIPRDPILAIGGKLDSAQRAESIDI